MQKILLVKTSSMGDVVHNLPVVTDLVAHFPLATIDWVVEEAFAAIPGMHAGLSNVIPVALRRWRRTITNANTWAEIRNFRQKLRLQDYDSILDTQGLIKSAVIARQALGVCYGYDRGSARESLAAVFYNRRFSVPWGSHAITRNRQLAAQALNYTLAAEIDFGISANSAALPWLPTQQYAVLLHGSSGANKLWPIDNWIRLGSYLANKGIVSLLPWGSEQEQSRSALLASQIAGAISPAWLGLEDIASLLGRAKVVIGVDTGLSHFAVALKCPVIGIYCATNPQETGLYGSDRIINVGNIGCAPDIAAVTSAVEKLLTP